MKSHFQLSTFIFQLLLLTACTTPVTNPTILNTLPPIYPDYIGVTIPVNIAPMDFDVNNPDGTTPDAIDVIVKGSKGGQVHTNGTTVDFDIDEWHDLTTQNRGGKLSFTVSTLHNGQWTQHKDFDMYVSNYDLDQWGLTYRRVAPGYEVYSHMGLYQRDLSTFDEYEIIDNNRTPGDCVNCHTANRTDPQQFLFHIRGNDGATAISRNGKLEMLNTSTDQTLGLCVYPYWHPDGRFVAFSTNITRQEYEINMHKRIEVFDHESDLQVYDADHHQLILSPLVKDTAYNETFPAFSPDGKTIYFCRTQKRQYPRDTRIVRYNLCSIPFNAHSASFGDSITTIINAEADSISISIPKPSYDGRYIMYTQANYGTFPIWHKEADLWLLDLNTLQRRPLTEVNSDDTESYHNWSANSHWFVFSSRRGDGLYTRLYIASITPDGKATKPFLLPQKSPRHYYTRLLYSYNVPDFTKSKIHLDSRATASAIRSTHRTSLTVVTP